MKKFALGLALLTIGSVVLPSTAIVYASENSQVVSLNENKATENVVIEYTEDGMVVTKYEDGYSAEDFADSSDIMSRAAVSRWGKKEYTNIAVTTGVAANAINAAFWAGGKAATSMFGIPGWAIAGLLTGASWTKKGSSPGNAVAKQWDKNGNGWIAFYYQRGYDAAGRVVATRYSTL
ncbi:hypothetical protein IGJ67_003079 [Enterococcus sp. MSG4989]|uniref:hypothetical protein n=1 Tax=Enterococcus sp. MSG4989 TaxID=2774759 RepID=UPI003F24F5B9